jgi:hypothetical protein
MSNEVKPTHHYGKSQITLRGFASWQKIPGRGGAGESADMLSQQLYNWPHPGNVTAKTPQTSQTEPITTPTLKSKVYTTGRGGTGNMAKNDNAEEARVAQDVDVPGITLPEAPHHTGRGGAANTYTPTNSERLEAHEHNKKVRSESFNKSHSRERASVKALADKAKDALTGKSGGESKWGLGDVLRGVGRSSQYLLH